LRTLGKGLKMIEKTLADLKAQNLDTLPGKLAFEMYDTYGFPVDLTQLILKENDMKLDIQGFEKEMKGQKDRSREDAVTENSDWTVIRETEGTEFTGYNSTTAEVNITRYRKVRSKGRECWHIVLDKTPFYAESGGQVGDTGILRFKDGAVKITDTVKENNLIIHIADSLPPDPSKTMGAEVDTGNREKTANNHTATHLLHYAMRSVLGKHVEQKGSLVTPDRLRFDFSHYSKPSPEELRRIEEIANSMVRGNYEGVVSDGITMDKALGMGAMALFGEKYGDRVRVVGFGDSVELCGGTHVKSTGKIGIIKIVSEGAIAAGIRRIEAVTGSGAEDFINEKLRTLDEIAALVKSTGSLTENVGRLVSENASMRKTIEKLQIKSCDDQLREFSSKAESRNGISFISGILESESVEIIKNSASRLRSNLAESVIAIGTETGGKATLLVLLTDDLVSKRGMSAVSIIKEIAVEINGGGGGQPFMASAGGKNPAGLTKAIARVAEIIDSL
ncbi:MAG: alanine--tRNA ligase-related protein, partial [Bacteroidales bacterium]|nr:alanine--tRNA ligase-related protein [Bacteroidales bacterium]